jgi:hypothetical protein
VGEIEDARVGQRLLPDYKTCVQHGAERVYGVVHAVQYAEDNVHTNGPENWETVDQWNLCERGNPFTCFAIWTNRHTESTTEKEMTDFDRFKMAASQIVGERLTWNEATPN